MLLAQSGSHTLYLLHSGQEIISVMLLDSDCQSYYEAVPCLISTGAADCCEVVNHEIHHSKTPTIMMSKRRKPATPHMARQRSFCQKEKKEKSDKGCL